MEKIWLKHYPTGIPAEINVAEYASVTALLEHAFVQHAQRQAYVCMGKGMSFAQLDAYSSQLAAW